MVDNFTTVVAQFIQDLFEIESVISIETFICVDELFCLLLNTYKLNCDMLFTSRKIAENLLDSLLQKDIFNYNFFY